MKNLGNKGSLLLEAILAVSLTVIILSSGYAILNLGFREWGSGEGTFETRYSSREAINRLMDEVRESYGVEILDGSEHGWIKVYKSMNKSSFITFRMKNNKFYVGFNNTLNSNSELTNFVDVFKVKYLPEGANFESAKGVSIEFVSRNNNQVFKIDTSAAFRVRQ